MNCKTITKSKIKLINYILNNNVSHNKASKYLLNCSKYFISNILQFIFNRQFNNTEYVYNKNYNVTDTTELRLIASRRTFL